MGRVVWERKTGNNIILGMDQGSVKDSISENRHGDRREINEQINQEGEDSGKKKKCPEDIGGEQLYQHDKLLEKCCPLSLEMHCISEGSRERGSQALLSTEGIPLCITIFCFYHSKEEA